MPLGDECFRTAFVWCVCHLNSTSPLTFNPNLKLNNLLMKKSDGIVKRNDGGI